MYPFAAIDYFFELASVLRFGTNELFYSAWVSIFLIESTASTVACENYFFIKRRTICLIFALYSLFSFSEI